MFESDSINVFGVRERNLQNIDVSIPKKQITVFTGVSGSGKSSLVFDTIAAESQRQLNDTYTSFIRQRLPHYGQPDVDRIEHLPVSFVINQKRLGGNSRSTVGTITDIYSLLRLLYSRIGTPFVGYAESFSFNNPKGMCDHCGGIGFVDSINIDKLLDKEKSLNEGAICFPTFDLGGWRIRRYIHSGLFDNDKKLREYSDKELHQLLYLDGFKLQNPDPEFPKTSLYEGLIPRIERSFLKEETDERNRHKKEIDAIVSRTTCPSCHGKRLNQTILSSKIDGKDISDCTDMQVDDLLSFLKNVHNPIATTIIASLVQQLEQMVAIGLGYLSLNRETPTLSGGESQRIKMVKQLGSSLCDVLYIFDEPSIGLHPHNIENINELFRLLRDKGNTVLIVEHDPDVIKIADYIVDMGPKAGQCGGRIVYQGNYENFKKADTLTSHYLSSSVEINTNPRQHNGYLKIQNASLHNLKNISVCIPAGVLTVVTGVAGSGKSSLINGVLAKEYPNSIFINQKGIQASKRSNIATFTGIFDVIRTLFAKANNASSSLFSFNSKGACPYCKGIGLIYTDLAFMETVSTRCDACEGKRYRPEVLQYELNGKNINEVLNMDIETAIHFFNDADISQVLYSLQEVGLQYITLGQSLDTLSGGELQRLKLASELTKKSNIYILDEPTTGLHISDIARLQKIFDNLVNAGNTLVVIEHNLDIIARADWVIDIGPGAGQAGGKLVFSGYPSQLLTAKESITGWHLNKYVNRGGCHA